MKLQHLFDGELEYEETTHTAVAPYGDGRWFGYTPAHGTFTGERLKGSVRCHNLYEQQSVEPEVFGPRYRGAIDTEDGALVLFAAGGLNRFDGPIGTTVMSMTFRSSHDRYLWLNDVVAIVEAVCFAVDDGQPGTERWTLRAFECVNELPTTDARPPAQ